LAVGLAVIVGGVVLVGAGAGAAGRTGHGLAAGGGARPAGHHAKGAAGTYVLIANGAEEVQLVLKADQTFQISAGQSGVWITTGKSIALSVTASPYGDAGCTFAGTVTARNLNSAKKPGNYVCPGGEGVFPWYALREKSVSPA
jgi:hypothetical protein